MTTASSSRASARKQAVSERAPLLGERSDSPHSFTRPSTMRRIRNFIGDSGITLHLSPSTLGRRGVWEEEISDTALVIPLLIITFSCALADSVTLAEYNVFATSMTGNTVLLATAAVGATHKSPLYAGVSLIGFVLAGLLFGQMGGVYGRRKRWWLFTTISLELVILAFAAVLAHPPVPRWLGLHTHAHWLYILCIGVQGGSQVAMAANGGVREMPTAMMTTPYAAFVSDPSLFASGEGRDVRARNRRFIYIVTFWVGAMLGAVVAKYSTVLVMTLIVIGLKVAAGSILVLQKGSIKPPPPPPSAIEAVPATEPIEAEEQRPPRRKSSILDRLSDQTPRDETTVAM